MIALSLVVVNAKPAHALSINIPTTIVNGSDFSSGPSFTVTDDFSANDTISLDVSGTVDIGALGLNGYKTNAAGVVVTPIKVLGVTLATGSANKDVLIPSNPDFGALILGNKTLGFHQLFPANSANGLGGSTPPTTLSFTNVTLSSIFGTGLTKGTSLEFLIAALPNSNNQGAFTVQGSINKASQPVPEPFTILGSVACGIGLVIKRKQAKSKLSAKA